MGEGAGGLNTWTIMIITYSALFEPAKIPFSDPMACGKAMPPIHEALRAEHPDVMVQCKSTPVPTTRPKARPEGNLDRK